jgi:hypothetical protein
LYQRLCGGLQKAVQVLSPLVLCTLDVAATLAFISQYLQPADIALQPWTSSPTASFALKLNILMDANVSIMPE